MPAQYIAMRNAFKKKGMNDKAAKAKAAAIYNAKHKDSPVGRYSEAFCNFMEKRWEKPDVNPEEIYAIYGKTNHPSSSSKNNHSSEARQRAMARAKTPVRRIRLGEQLVGAGGNEGNEQGATSAGSPTASKTSKGLKLKYPKKPEEVVKPLANEAFCQFMKMYNDKE